MASRVRQPASGSLARHLLLFAFATIAARFFGVVKSFWLARILQPADYGVWIFILLISSYAPILSLGTVETLMKRVPFFRGKGDHEAVGTIEGGVFSFTLIVAAIFLAASFLVPLALRGETLRRFALPSRLMLLAVTFSSVSSVYYYRLQARHSFDAVSAIATARSAAVLLFQIALGYLWGLNGAVAGFLISEIVVLGYSLLLNARLHEPIRPRAGARLYGDLIRTGLPITIVWWTYMIQTTVDRAVAMAMLGDAATGYYGIGMSIAATFLLLPDAINQVLYPRVSELYGRTQDARHLSPLVVDPARMISLALPLFACLSMLVLPLVFDFIVPQYLPGLGAAQILIVAALYSALTKGGANLLISVDRQWRVLAYLLASIALNLCGNVLFVRLGLGIEGIAASTAIATSFLAVAVWCSVFATVGERRRECARSTASLFGPAFLFTVLIGGYRVAIRRFDERSILSILALLGVMLVYWGILLAIPAYRASIRQALRTVSSALLSRLTRGSGAAPEADAPPGEDLP